LLYIDLDGFKRINDTDGHAAGDALLVALTERLRGCLRGADSIAHRVETAARLGGDEFVVLLADCGGPAAVAAVADRILATVSPAFDLAGAARSVTASIGIAMFPSDGSDAATLLQAADRAMYCAKSAGRNAWRFHSSPAAATVTPVVTRHSYAA
jgi:diguanylate cyclase (GGDEF)-like protein